MSWRVISGHDGVVIGLAPRPRSSNTRSGAVGTKKLTCSPSRRAATLTPIRRPWSSSAGPPLMPELSEPPKNSVSRKLRSTGPL